MALHTLVIIVRHMRKIFLSKFNFFLWLLKFHFFACLPANSIGSGRRFLHKDLIDAGPGNDSNLLGRFADFAQNGSMATVIGQSIKKVVGRRNLPPTLIFIWKVFWEIGGGDRILPPALIFTNRGNDFFLFRVTIQSPSACLIKKNFQDWAKKIFETYCFAVI